MNDKYMVRAREIVSAMTEEEKLGLLSTHHRAVERLGLGEFYIGTEVARGYVGRDREHPSTVLPQPVGLAATFDRELMKKLGEIAGLEARAYYNKEKRGGLCLWGPTVDMVRNPLWGRTEEAYGEDVFLAGELTAAYTLGMAGDNGEHFMTVPTLKHFCANNNEERRGSCNAYLPLRLKYEYYYAAFENAIRWGGARSVMAAYNEINGVPAIMNPELETMLKEQWGLWFVVSDGGDFSQNVVSHRYTDSLAEAYPPSLLGGCDVMTDAEDMVAAAAKKALDEGLITWAEIDKSLTRTICARLTLGQIGSCEFDGIGEEVIDCEEHRELNRRAAREQVVLLKNNGILPLKTPPKSVAVVGPLADDILMDWYTGYATYEHTILDGIKKVFPNVTGGEGYSLWGSVVLRACNGKYLDFDDDELFACSDEPRAFQHQVWGEGWVNFYSAERHCYIRKDDSGKLLPHNRRVYDWFTRETFNIKPYGDKYIIEDYLDHMRLVAKPDGTLRFEKRTAVTEDCLWDIEVMETDTAQAKRIAESHDVVIYCVGNHPTQVAKECYDRRTLALNIQPGMTQTLCKANPNTILCVVSSYPYSICEESEAAAAVIWTSHAGAELGTAISEVITGQYSPAGRLPLTWYRSEHDLPDIIDYDIETAGSTYMYFKGKPLFPFGYGLSYGSFEYISMGAVQDSHGGVKIEVLVRNTSDIPCDEVVQVYYTVKGSAVKRPIRKLCGFERVHFEPNQRLTVMIDVPEHILRIYDVRRQQMIVEGGSYTFMVGASCEDIRLTKEIEIKGEGLAARADSFPAMTYDGCRDVKLFWSKTERRNYARCTHYNGTVEYGGLDLAGVKAVRFTASSIMGHKNIELIAGDEKVSVRLSPSDGYADFAEYTVSLPEGVSGNKLTFFLQQDCGLMDIELIR